MGQVQYRWCIKRVSRGNPGLSSYAFCLRDEHGDIIYAEAAKLHETTNTITEALAVLKATTHCKQAGYNQGFDIKDYPGEWSFWHVVDVKSVHHFAPGSSFSFVFTALVNPSESESDSSSESDSEPSPEDGIYTDDFGFMSESNSDSDSDLDSEQKVDDDDDDEGDALSGYVRLEPLPIEHDYTNCTYCKISMADSNSDDEYVIDKDCWNKYLQQLNESEGFDIKDYPSGHPAATVFPIPAYWEIPSYAETMKGYAAKALKLYNEKFDTKYEVNEILKVNEDECGTYLIFYVTFTVTNGENEYFQAKVVRREWSFRRIVDVKSVHCSSACLDSPIDFRPKITPGTWVHPKNRGYSTPKMARLHHFTGLTQPNRPENQNTHTRSLLSLPGKA
ncbi:putative zeatin O-glucosyltransferase-like [Capsicum annuum]|nr:putative zeatin O-glucosyltransferase-like [Capsicum annuum]